MSAQPVTSTTPASDTEDTVTTATTVPAVIVEAEAIAAAEAGRIGADERKRLAVLAKLRTTYDGVATADITVKSAESEVKGAEGRLAEAKAAASKEWLATCRQFANAAKIYYNGDYKAVVGAVLTERSDKDLKGLVIRWVAVYALGGMDALTADEINALRLGLRKVKENKPLKAGPVKGSLTLIDQWVGECKSVKELAAKVTEWVEGPADAPNDPPSIDKRVPKWIEAASKNLTKVSDTQATGRLLTISERAALDAIAKQVASMLARDLEAAKAVKS